MKTLILFTLIFLSACSSSSTAPNGDSQYESFAPDGIPFIVSATEWKADLQGNHRAVVSVKEKSAVAVAELPWRRPDLRPETKKIIVVDAKTGNEIKNVCVRSLTSEKGVIAFEPITTPGEYYVYYLPYTYRKGWNDARYGKPWNDYLPPVYEADSIWAKTAVGETATFMQAKVERFESRTRFDAFTSMGIIATQEEMDKIRNEANESPILFTEDRAFPIRLVNQLPARWAMNGPSSSFKGEAMPNEYYVWQVGVWAAKEQLKNVRLQFTDFIHSAGKERIPKEEVTCFNQEGINWDGSPISFTVNVAKDKIQALWCGIQIPEKAKSGKYTSEATLTADGITPRNIQIEIDVEGAMLADKGDGDLWRHARLRWLNSKIGDDLLPVAPYQAMTVNENEITATDKKIKINTDGLPESILINEHEVLAEPVRFIVETNKGAINYQADNRTISKEADGRVSWKSSSLQDGLRFTCKAHMEYDGYIRYNLEVASDNETKVNDIKLITTYTPYSAEYFMGTGFKGGFRPTNYVWDWKGPWDSYWMGGAKAGLHVEFRGGTYHGPLINDYKPAAPQCWANDGKGKVTVSGAKGQKALLTASTGRCTLDAKGTNFEFSLLITPVKPVNPSKHFSERYFHAESSEFDKAAEEGANIANIHHARKLNPVINYPFIVRDSLIQYIKHQHQNNRKVKLYYTIRELTNYVHEIYALKSLNHEIFAEGVGYGLPWHTEHLIDDYKAAWYTELPGERSDAALVLSGFSRWINYYLEGLRWMFENYEIDGIYMDDVSFDRTVMKRMRKIMNQYHPGALIDLHSNTGYSIGPANQYTDFFPYVDRLWFGESFKYNQMAPDEWFVTFSGIPFGQMSEMLQDGGNRFLGMTYGATARHSYGEYSPAPVWALWKSFGIEEAQMLGYWDENSPNSVSHPNVKATAYVKPGKVLISLANFDNKDQLVRLSFNWKALGLDPTKVELKAPSVADYQETTTFNPNENIPVKSKEGWLLILSEK
ncbi:MAG: DUF6067 family protein [Tannerellaceae bacterium]